MTFAFHLLSRLGWSLGLILIVLTSLGLGAALAMKFPWADRHQKWVTAGIGVALLCGGWIAGKMMGVL